MGKPDMKKKINILHVVEFAVALLIALCMADNACIHCGKHVIEMQLICATAFGFLMIMSVLFLGMFLDENVGPKTDLCYNAMGGVMCIISGIFVLLFATDNSDGLENYNYYRLLIGGAGFLANGIIFLVEFFLLIFKKGNLEGRID